MSSLYQKYCLDANVLIQAWRYYYAPDICSDYWMLLNDLGKQGKIFIPSIVREEITRTDDDLAKWLKGCNIPVIAQNEQVGVCMKKIFAANSSHIGLVDNVKGRSLADPWVIAHAMHDGATVVTKENKVTETKSAKIKIPNVCENMGVRCITDFEFITELKIRFSCSISY
jgi:predicted nucleic acid-binding protein